MKIVICGSMAFAEEMRSAQNILEEKGHQVILPEFVEVFVKYKALQSQAKQGGGLEGARWKKEYDLIRRHYQKIKNADAILVLNFEKKGIPNYIGGNSFLEMGFAHVLRKKIYLLNEIPTFDFCYEELLAMEPIVLKGDLKNLN